MDGNDVSPESLLRLGLVTSKNKIVRSCVDCRTVKVVLSNTSNHCQTLALMSPITSVCYRNIAVLTIQFIYYNIRFGNVLRVLLWLRNLSQRAFLCRDRFIIIVVYNVFKNIFYPRKLNTAKLFRFFCVQICTRNSAVILLFSPSRVSMHRKDVSSHHRQDSSG